MKKIGLLTLYKDNYGSILQCFATKQFLSNYGFEVQLFSVKESANHKYKIRKLVKGVERVLLSPNYLKDRKIRNESFDKDIKWLSDDTKKIMDEFITDKIKPLIVDFKYLQNIGHSDEYSYFIAGSDQIWNASRPINEEYMLTFTYEYKRIAFGPSIGVSKIPNYNKKTLKKINNFKAVSLREESAIKLLRPYVKNKNIIRVGDPTVLFNKKERMSFIEEKKINDNFVLIHFLNKPNSLAISNIIKYVKIYNCRPIIIGYGEDIKELIPNSLFVNCNPFEFLSYLSNAKCIFTDSYHSVLFSINFSKNFFCFERQYTHSFSQQSRILDLLSRTKLLDRYIISDIIDFDNFPVVNEIVLNNDRTVTREFLNKAILGGTLNGK